MPIRYFFHPLLLFLVPSLVAVTAWAVTPETWFSDLRITQKVDFSAFWFPWFLSFVLFTIGYALRKGTFVIPSEQTLPNDKANEQAQWFTLLVSSFSMVVLAFLVIRSAGVSGLWQAYVVRQNYVGGVTTFTLLSTAALTFAGCMYLSRGSIKSICLIPLVAGTMYAGYRAVFGYERVALLIPMVALMVSYALMRYRRLTFSMVALGLVAFAGVLVIFVAAEYFRTFGVKLAYGESINENPILYGLQRFVMYFSTSVNSGGVEYELSRMGMATQPLFSATFSPLATVLYSLLGITPNTGAMGVTSTDVAVSMGFFNPEFNNRWGVVTPFTEGMISGSVFWVIWGFYGTHLYLMVTRLRPEPWNLALFGLFVAAFVDNQSRVGLLAAPHFLVPFLWLVVLRIGYRMIGFTNTMNLRKFIGKNWQQNKALEQVAAPVGVAPMGALNGDSKELRVQVSCGGSTARR